MKLLIDHCIVRGISNKISRAKYESLYQEYSDKLMWGKEVKRCIDWLYDNDKKILTSQRLRNWMRKSLEFQKQQELKNLSKYQDKSIPKPHNPEPLWTPPTN